MESDSSCVYAIVKKVQIEEVTTDTISFLTRAADNEPRIFTTKRSTIFDGVLLQDAPVPVLLEKDAVGNLYLSRDGWEITSDDVHLFGYNDDTIMRFKWPQCLGEMACYTSKTLKPSSIQIIGFRKQPGGAKESISIDIWNEGAPAQQIHWNGAQYIKLKLGSGGSAESIDVWPTKIVVQGHTDETLKYDQLGLSVDILNHRLASLTQDLVWGSKKSTITLVLTSEGCASLGLVPGGIEQLALGNRWFGDSDLVDQVESFKDRLVEGQRRILDQACGRLGGNRVRLITIVGKPADETTSKPSFLSHVSEQLDSGELTPKKREVFRASSIVEIHAVLAKVLRETPRARISLQIVSHASSGILWLGYYGGAISDESPFYYMDSDPDSLVLLAQFGRSRKLTEVTVVGCDVADASSVGNGSNGRTLMYALAELLQCKVVGATDAVGLDEFDANGEYKPNDVHSGPAGWQWHPHREPEWISGKPAARPPALGPSQSFDITAIHGTSLRAPYPGYSVYLDKPIEVEGKEHPDPAFRHLAPDMSVTLRSRCSGAVDLKGAVLRGGRLLRVEDAHYHIEESARLFETLREQLEHCACTGSRPKRSIAKAP